MDVVPDEAVYVLSEQGTTVLHGAGVRDLVPLLDGSRTLDGVLADAPPHLPPVEVCELIGELARADLVGYRDPAVDPAVEAYWELAGVGGPGALASVRATPVEVVALGNADGSAVREECRAAGLQLAGSARSAAFSVVVCEDYLDPALAELDRARRAARQPWLLARSGGPEVWVGPVFGVPDGPCWRCLQHRLRGHRSSQAAVQQALGLAGPVPLPPASLAAVRMLALHTTVLEALKWVAGMRYPGQRAVCRLDTRTLASRHHEVPRRPQCPGCGDPGLVGRGLSRPVVPVSRPKADGGGNDRAMTPAAALERYRHLVDPITGVVAEVRPVPGAPSGSRRYVSGRNLALAGRSLAAVRGGLRSHSGGKGVTAQEAEMSALGEAVERYCGTRQGDEAVVRDTLTSLGSQALHPNECQLYADWQFAERGRWNAAHDALQAVPAPFDTRALTDWTPVWSLTAGAHRLLPTRMLYFDPDAGADPDAHGPGLTADSNGNAAGTSLEDAVVQGFLEVVERDAVALWWYNRPRRPAVDLDAFDEPWLAEARAGYARLGRELWVLDLTADLGIPVMAAVSRRTGPAERISFGFGAHTDPRRALRRAVTEMCQLLPPGEAAGDGNGPCAPTGNAALDAWWRHATVRNQPFLVPDAGQSALGPSAYDHRPRGDLREDIEDFESLVRARGMELLVLDQTRPDVGLPVVKVIVPGMRHFWARLAPGRLFDVPVELGWLDRRTRRADLNPVPLFV
ncbi:TOMM precursor leader peptide-binding protein [Streptomyces durbertensis]|uniref:TOMM precursor leader peptide-binding protein n=1 Tax=Streptomyces durbertensis TaxID=2448886 RepID=UPI002B22044F|nr:TOMM precursor leader peptide-binding protein [Streptomyces durbertensis]